LKSKNKENLNELMTNTPDTKKRYTNIITELNKSLDGINENKLMIF
jgi:hypothetical protein